VTQEETLTFNETVYFLCEEKRGGGRKKKRSGRTSKDTGQLDLSCIGGGGEEEERTDEG